MESGVSTRTSIIDAAGRVFAQFGLRKTTMGEIIRAAGYSRGTVYKHFATKEDVFHAVVSRELEDILSSVREAMESETSARGKLRAAALTQFEAVNEKMNVYRVTMQSWAELAWDARFARLHAHGEGPLDRPLCELITDIVRHGVEQGEIETDDLEMTATVIQASLKGAAMMVLFRAELDGFRPIVERMVEMIFDGLRPREETA